MENISRLRERHFEHVMKYGVLHSSHLGGRAWYHVRRI
jgi:hypothetical protein